MLKSNAPTLLMLALQALVYAAQNLGWLTGDQAMGLMATIATLGAATMHRMDPPKPKTTDAAKVAIVLAVLTLSCGSIPTGNDEVDSFVGDICAEHNALCVGATTKEELAETFPELAPYVDTLWWGRFSRAWGEIQDPLLSWTPGVVCFDDVRCARNLVRCGGIVHHEIGHQKRGSSQIDADRWAIRNAPEEQARDLAGFVCTFGAEEGYGERLDDGRTPRCAAAEQAVCEFWGCS